MLHRKLILVLLLTSQVVLAQSTSSGLGASSKSSSTSSTERNPVDDITAVAPPFDVDDVLRMRRVGLQDEVIINALRARYHPLKLSEEEKARLKNHQVSDAVISAMENPLGANPFAAPPAELPPSPPVPAKPAELSKPAAPETVTAKQEDKPAASTAEAKSADASMVSTTRGRDITASLHLPIPPAKQIANVGNNSMLTVDMPTLPGVYQRVSNEGWEEIKPVPVEWQHDLSTPTKNVVGRLSGEYSQSRMLSSEADFLIVTSETISVVQYQLVKFHSDTGSRVFHPSPGGAAFGGEGKEIVGFRPERLSNTMWLISLHGLHKGEYGFLPPVRSVLHSKTGFADEIYPFHVF